MIIWMDLALLYFGLTHPFYWDWMIGSCEIHLNVAVDLFYLLIFDVWLRGTLQDISWRMGSSSIVIASAQGIFPVDAWPRFDDSLEVCFCDFIQLCGKFLWLTFDIITNYRGIHKQANVLRRYGVCVDLYEFIFPMLSPSIFSTHRYFRDLVKIHSWTTPGQFYHKHIPYSLNHQYCFYIYVYIYDYICMILFISHEMSHQNPPRYLLHSWWTWALEP